MDPNLGKGAIKKRKIRDFQLLWLDEDNFKGWLAPHPVENKALHALHATQSSNIAKQI